MKRKKEIMCLLHKELQENFYPFWNNNYENASLANLMEHVRSNPNSAVFTTKTIEDKKLEITVYVNQYHVTKYE